MTYTLCCLSIVITISSLLSPWTYLFACFHHHLFTMVCSNPSFHMPWPPTLCYCHDLFLLTFLSCSLYIWQVWFKIFIKFCFELCLVFVVWIVVLVTWSKAKWIMHKLCCVWAGTLCHVNTNSQTFNTLWVKFAHVELLELKSIACSTNL